MEDTEQRDRIEAIIETLSDVADHLMKRAGHISAFSSVLKAALAQGADLDVIDGIIKANHIVFVLKHELEAIEFLKGKVGELDEPSD